MIIPARRAFFLGAFLAAAAPAFAAPSAWLMMATGHVDVEGPSGPIAANPPVLLPDGTTIKTGGDGLALIETSDGSKIKLRAGSDFTLKTVSDRESAFSLLKGAISCWVAHVDGRRFSVRTPASVGAVRGTIFDVFVAGGITRFDLFQGEMLIADLFGGRMIESPSQRVTVSAVRGLVGTSSLPPGAHAEAEPSAGPLPVVAQAAAAPKPKAPAPPPALSSESSLPPMLLAAPPPTPKQEQTVVSPSAP